MNYQKIAETLSHVKNAYAELNAGVLLLNEILGAYDAQEDLADYRRSLFRIVENTNQGGDETPESQKENPDAGTSGAEQGFAEFTDMEIRQMPSNFRRLIIINKKRCRMRKHVSGKNSTTYEIRFRQDGYDLSACGKTIELAKANLIKKMKTAKPKNQDEFTSVPTTFKAFTTYYFEKFRKPKVADETYRKDLNRLQLHVFPVLNEMPFSKITPTVCQNLLDDICNKGLSKTAKEVLSLLSIIFKGAIAHTLMQRNPLNVVLFIKTEQVHGKALTREEEKLLFEKVGGTPRGILYAILLYTGLRPNELATVRVEGSFIVANNSKRKNKRKEDKRIYICKNLASVLNNVTIPKLNINYISTEFPKFCPNHKLYDLRTTFNTRCKELGVSDHARMHFMGHSLGALGNAYTDLSDEYLLKEGKKLDEW